MVSATELRGCGLAGRSEMSPGPRLTVVRVEVQGS